MRFFSVSAVALSAALFLSGCVAAAEPVPEEIATSNPTTPAEILLAAADASLAAAVENGYVEKITDEDVIDMVGVYDPTYDGEAKLVMWDRRDGTYLPLPGEAVTMEDGGMLNLGGLVDQIRNGGDEWTEVPAEEAYTSDSGTVLESFRTEIAGKELIIAIDGKKIAMAIGRNLDKSGAITTTFFYEVTDEGRLALEGGNATP